MTSATGEGRGQRMRPAPTPCGKTPSGTGDATLATLIEAMPRATLVVGPDGRIRVANEAVVHTFGHDVDALVGQSVEWLLPLGGGPSASILAERRTRMTAAPRDREAHRADGSSFPVEVTTRPVALADGEGTILCVEDLSARRSLEAQLQQAQKLAVLGQLAGVIAHDFRNYLNAIRGFAELVEAEGPVEPPTAAGLQRIVDTVDHAAGAVESMLAYARPQASDEVTGDLSAHLASCQPMLRNLARPSCRLDLRVADALPAVAIEPAALTQVLMNLVANARDAMPTGGRVTVSAHAEDPSGWARRDGDRVAIEVRDSGGGMDGATLDRIFEPFFSTKRAGPHGSGTGLGLASVRMIVARAGGEVTVESTPGCGTTFRVLLPVVLPDA